MPTSFGEYYNTGTIDLTAGSTAVTGTGVGWTDIIEGDILEAQGRQATISSVGAGFDTITLMLPWAGTTATAVAYVIRKDAKGRFDPALTQAKLREFIEQLQGASLIYSVSGSAPDNAVGDDGQYAIKPNTGDNIWQMWQKVSGVWVSLATEAPVNGGNVSGRLTLTTGVPITSSDVVGAANIYFTPAWGNTIPVWDGSRTLNVAFTELSLALDPNTGHTGYHQAGRNFDVFYADISGTYYFGTGPSWNDGAGAGSDTARGTGVGSTELEYRAGILVNKYSMSLRTGTSTGDLVTVPSNQATFLGSIRTTANGLTEDSHSKRFVSNLYQVSDRNMYASDPTNSWTYTTAAFRQANNSVVNQVEMLLCVAGRIVDAEVLCLVSNSTTTFVFGAPGIGINSATANSAQINVASVCNSTFPNSGHAKFRGPLALGYNKLVNLEKGSAVDTQTWYGDFGNPDNFQTGIIASVEN